MRQWQTIAFTFFAFVLIFPASAKPAKKAADPKMGTFEKMEFKANCKEALRVASSKKIKRIESPSSVKPRAALRYWADTETPNFMHPSQFTYSVPTLTSKTTAEESRELIRSVLLAALLADEFIADEFRKGEAKGFTLELNRVETEAAVGTGVNSVASSAGFGEMPKLVEKMVRVFESPEKRTLFYGTATADMGSIEYGGEFVLILDSEKSEISAIAHGDLFEAFSTPGPSNE